MRGKVPMFAGETMINNSQSQPPQRLRLARNVLPIHKHNQSMPSPLIYALNGQVRHSMVTRSMGNPHRNDTWSIRVFAKYKFAHSLSLPARFGNMSVIQLRTKQTRESSRRANEACEGVIWSW